MTSNDILSRINRWFKNSISIKFLIIGFLILLLLIPMSMVQGLIREREQTKYSAIAEVQQKWGGQQELTGPVLTIPYYVYSNDGDNLVKSTYYAHFLPEDIDVNGELFPQNRNRGIYDITVYNSQVQVKGRFKTPDFSTLGVPLANVEWSQASLNLGISDMRGIKENIQLDWNNTSLDFEPGVESEGVISSGVSSKVDFSDSTSEYAFSFDLNLNGSRSLYFIPVGKQTKVKLTSDWPDPKFDGAFLPDPMEVKDGFNAEWKILHVNRNFPQQWKGPRNLQTSAFGVQLLTGVSQYQKSTRSAKYAILIIVLTFLTYFFTEILHKKKIHPVQYLLVGIALCVFYTLLISISEHLGFTKAYIIASVATVSMVSLYTASIVKKLTVTIFNTATLAALYFFVFILLQEQDYALLMGSVGLFLTLGLVMYFSKRIIWYQEEEPKTELEN